MNEAELEYVQQDDVEKSAVATEKVGVAGVPPANAAAGVSPAAEEKPISFFKCFTFRQTWSFIVGKFFTDGVWWFYLFWAPAYFKELGHGPVTGMGQALIFTLYLIVTVVSIYGCKLPTIFIDKGFFGGNPYMCRMRAMLIFAFFPLAALVTQPLAGVSVWFPACLIGLAAAGHQAWSANIFSTVGDMFPKSTIASVTGMGAMAGGLGSFIIQKGAGKLFTYAETQGQAFSFLGYAGKPANDELWSEFRAAQNSYWEANNASRDAQRRERAERLQETMERKNGQIEHLKDQNETLTTRLESTLNPEKVAMIKRWIAQNEERVDEITKDVDKLKKRI